MSILSIKELTKTYHQGHAVIPVLNQLELEVKEGEVVAIIGKSGAGKSTLLSLMAGLDAPDSGTITVDNVQLSSASEQEKGAFRSKKLGIVFQQYHLMSSLTAIENVALPLEILGDKNAMNAAQSALDAVNLSHRLDHRPQQLSGGECQRVAIARAFVARPSLLLADEPSGNLDEETGKLVLDQLFEMVSETKMTMVLVTHNHDLADRCQRTLTLERGILC